MYTFFKHTHRYNDQDLCDSDVKGVEYPDTGYDKTCSGVVPAPLSTIFLPTHDYQFSTDQSSNPWVSCCRIGESSSLVALAGQQVRREYEAASRELGSYNISRVIEQAVHTRVAGAAIEDQPSKEDQLQARRFSRTLLASERHETLVATVMTRGNLRLHISTLARCGITKAEKPLIYYDCNVKAGHSFETIQR